MREHRSGLGMAAALLCLGLCSAQAAERVQYRSDQYGRQRDGGGGGAPGGSYQQSCSNARRDGSTLFAVCKGERGRRFETTLDLGRCRGSDIGNNNGTLDCAGVRGSSRRVD